MNLKLLIALLIVSLISAAWTSVLLYRNYRKPKVYWIMMEVNFDKGESTMSIGTAPGVSSQYDFLRITNGESIKASFGLNLDGIK